MNSVLDLVKAMKHKKKYINWKEEGSIVTVSNEKFKIKLEGFAALGYNKLSAKTIRAGYANGYFREKVGNWERLYVKESEKFVIYSTNVFDLKKNERTDGTKGGITLLTQKFREDHPELGRYAINKAFGKSPEEIKSCIPKQFYYFNPNYSSSRGYIEVIKHVGAVDDSSHYPACARGALPDYNRSVIKKGMVEPTKEYPFAYWPEIGCCAELDRFDMRDWVEDDEFAPRLFVDLGLTCTKANYTVLCPASSYELGPEFEYFYSLRKEDIGAKLVMNKSIGQMHQKNEGFKKYDQHPLAHLAAIIIGRANQAHLDMINKIGRSRVLQVVVDGLIYLGKERYGVDESEKALGKYVQEFTDAEVVFNNILCYMIKDFENNKVKVKTSPYNRYSDGRIIDEKDFDINTPYDVMWDMITVKEI